MGSHSRDIGRTLQNQDSRDSHLPLKNYSQSLSQGGSRAVLAPRELYLSTASAADPRLSKTSKRTARAILLEFQGERYLAVSTSSWDPRLLQIDRACENILGISPARDGGGGAGTATGMGIAAGGCESRLCGGPGPSQAPKLQNFNFLTYACEQYVTSQGFLRAIIPCKAGNRISRGKPPTSA